ADARALNCGVHPDGHAVVQCIPPTTSTFPFFSKVAVWNSRGVSIVPIEVKALAATCPDALLMQRLKVRRGRINSGRMRVGPQMELDSDTAVRRRILLRLLLQWASRSKNDELNTFCQKKFYTGSGACRNQAWLLKNSFFQN